MWDEMIEVTVPIKTTTNTVQQILKKKNFCILHTFLLITIAVLIAVSI